MVPALLPIKERARDLILETTAALQSHFSEITAAWRKQMFAEFAFEGRAMAALERLNLGTGFVLFCKSDSDPISKKIKKLKNWFSL